MDAKEEVVDIELADERQILEELQGKTKSDERWIYPIQGGYQLSYKAVKLACRRFAEHGEAIEVDFPADVRYDPQNPEYILVQVRASRVQIVPKTGARIVLDSTIGTKRKWVKERLRDGTVRPDQNFFEKAVAQAERNAKMALLPQDFIRDFVDQILKNQTYSSSQPQKKEEAKAPPQPPKKEEAKAPPQPPKKEEAKASPPQPPKKEEAKDPSPQPPKQNGKSAEISALHQQFWAVLKSVTKNKDESAGRLALKRLTGKERVSELTETELKCLGGLLRKVSKGECEIKTDEKDKNKSIIVDGPTKEVVWPQGYKDEAPRTPQEDTPPDGGEWLI